MEKFEVSNTGDLGDAKHFFPILSIYFYIFFHGHAASCAEAAAKDLRNAPRGRVASLMESWEEDGLRQLRSF